MQRNNVRDYSINNKLIRSSASWNNPNERAISVIFQLPITHTHHIEELTRRKKAISQIQPGVIEEQDDHLTLLMLFPTESQFGSLAKILNSINQTYQHDMFDLTLKAENHVFGEKKKFPAAVFESDFLSNIFSKLVTACNANNINNKPISTQLSAHASLIQGIDAQNLLPTFMDDFKKIPSLAICESVSAQDIKLTYKTSDQIVSLDVSELTLLAEKAFEQIEKDKLEVESIGKDSHKRYNFFARVITTPQSTASEAQKTFLNK